MYQIHLFMSLDCLGALRSGGAAVSTRNVYCVFLTEG